MNITLDNIAFYYGKKRRKSAPPLRPTLHDISLTITPGEMVALAGRSGSGKSTLLQLIKGFIPPSDGHIRLNGRDPHVKGQDEDFDPIGLIFQYPEHQLFARTVFEDIAFGLRYQPLDEDEKQLRVRQAMAAVQLDYDTFHARSPFELSGGEKRRVAIAGIIVLSPEVLILDEPTAGLDLQSRQALFQLLHQLHQDKALTIIWVSHQLEEIAQHADRLVVLDQGAIVADSSPQRIFADPTLCQRFGWQEPTGLVVSRLLRENGHRTSGWISAQQAAEVIAGQQRPPALADYL